MSQAEDVNRCCAVPQRLSLNFQRQSALGCGPANGEWITICATFRARLAGTLALQANQLMDGGRLLRGCVVPEHSGRETGWSQV